MVVFAFGSGCLMQGAFNSFTLSPLPLIDEAVQSQAVSVWTERWSQALKQGVVVKLQSRTMGLKLS